MDMEHIFKEGQPGNKNTLLLLHGTGGDENDLLPLANLIDPGAAILSVRGNSREGNMNRFFRRLEEGVFDQEDLVLKTKELKDFVDQAAVNYGFDRKHVVAVGYSNGANIAGSLLYHYDNPLKGAALFHPMVPRRDIAVAGKDNTPVFIGAGKNDPICPADEAKELNEALTKAGAEVELYWTEHGHQLTQDEVNQAAAWYMTKLKGTE
ncbi:alpha/beta hydrolase [Evansella clarkii]|jgi:phospholipase/carboxylesterase|uniref:alpha/beta hydrolase n=1 Tax=Evansella clarkii TaxID=79879 RepID=UPI0015A736D1|nr:alpha/beta hydrolase [Evansella clarkii]